MKTLCIAQCGHRKIWKDNPNAGPTPAKFAYTGVFAKKTQEYARAFYPHDWCILSAKYGFLMPDDLIEDYNVTFIDSGSHPISIVELTQCAKDKNLMVYDEYIVLAGRVYVDKVTSVFGHENKKIVKPLFGIVGNGRMMQLMNLAIISKSQIEQR